MTTLYRMDLETGEVRSDDEWLALLPAWEDGGRERFERLVQVERDENGNWM